MKRSSTSALLLMALPLVLVAVSGVFAAPNEHLDWGAQLHSGGGSCPGGSLVINVVQKVVNSADSATTRPVWAFDDYIRHIQVVETSPGQFCATVEYKGSFSSIAGDSPGASYNPGGTVGDGVVGTFEGGYVSTVFNATLKASPARRAKGSIGTDDYNCDASGHCSDFFWGDLYFDNIAGFDLAWWGWIYHAGNNGSWTNAITGNSGDITGN